MSDFRSSSTGSHSPLFRRNQVSDHHADTSSHHAEAVHPVGAVIMVVILAALFGLLIGVMNEGDTTALIVAGVIFGAFGLFAVFGLGKVDEE